MSNCPKCKEEICTLSFSGLAVVFQTFSLDGEEPEYQTESTEFKGGEEFFCPLCDKLLFTSEDDATKFLKGEN